ncbi:MAG: DUF2892 domain-containing protein [Thermodesulfobacteriota bacterium]
MRLSIPQNMGIADRIIRVCLGIVLAILGSLIVKGAIGIFLVTVSALMLLTALIGFCPGYVPLRISTKRQKASG